jgi:hypothetical protein
MSRPSIPKTTADALRQKVYASWRRAEAKTLASTNPIEARWRQLEADDMDQYAQTFLALPEESVSVGAGGEMVPTGEIANERPDFVDTVRSEPDMITARASVARLGLMADTSALDLAVECCRHDQSPELVGKDAVAPDRCGTLTRHEIRREIRAIARVRHVLGDDRPATGIQH